ncbi:MAG TPA: hypothetical protein VMT00_04510 [Thermoanaerobaculia bacterium]|nr:hypothetical protein [Thermoanaerobaculia bacterium]
MKKLAVFVCLLIVLVIVKRQFLDKGTSAEPSPDGETSLVSSMGGMFNDSPEAKTRKRFEHFMQRWQKGGVSLDADEQAATCLWARGVVFIADRDDLEDAVNHFDRWRRQKDLYVQNIQYEIRGYQRESDRTIAEVRINGQNHRIAIPDSPNPLSWIQ